MRLQRKIECVIRVKEAEKEKHIHYLHDKSRGLNPNHTCPEPRPSLALLWILLNPNPSNHISGTMLCSRFQMLSRATCSPLTTHWQ